jgi:hypothetical protein
LTVSEICNSIDSRLRPQARILAKQLTTIGKRLEEERKKFPDQKLLVHYDNGGGQSGMRENPFFPAYEKLLASYMKCISTLAELLGDSAQAETATLDRLRDRFKVG